ncbi:MAG: hypothetical protein ACHQII_00550 [Bacteroidia bacterium]
MNAILYVVIIILVYKAVMPFIAWIVPLDRMSSAAKYIEQTERRFPTETVFRVFKQIQYRKLKDKGT